MQSTAMLGIIGSGSLGGAIARGLLQARFLKPDDLWIANRSGNTTGFEEWPGINFTTSNQELADACQAIILAVPPHLASAMNFRAHDRLVISVMAGVTMTRLAQLTRARRLVRAMSSPAAERNLAYSPWFAGEDVTEKDRSLVDSLFASCGKTDEVFREEHIDCFTALTGPIPGFVAYFADCMVRFATDNGIDPGTAQRAIKQLFLASGLVLADEPASPADQVLSMIDYAGTTAAGLKTMRNSPLASLIHEGLEAARLKARELGTEG